MPGQVSLRFPIERHNLDNGLRVVLAPDRSAPVVAVAVYYDVGFRSEPEGRTGFAHLFEHMMFQGSEHLDKMEHVKHVMGNGGTLNGSTSPDYTNYYEAMPSSALDLALFLEADRMRSLRITRENLDNQISVVKEEIRVNVLNRPYGGFPWIHLADVMFDTFANAHNGYGSFEDLEAAQVEDAADFWDRYYAPGNAVLVVVGDFENDESLAMVEDRFGSIPARRPPRHPSFAEPVPDEPRHGRHHDPNAPTPALALGYRVPDPVGDPEGIAALTVLSALLTDGEASRLRQRLVRDTGLVTDVSSWLGVFPGTTGPPERDPSRFQILAFHANEDDRERIIATVDEEVAAVATGPDPDQVRRVTAKLTGSFLRTVDGFLSRALAIAPLELFQDGADRLDEYPAVLAAVEPEAVAEAARRWLDPATRTVLDLVAGGEG